MPKIIIIPGSTRKGSFNVKLGNAIARKLEALGVETTQVDLAHYEMPIYDQDIESESGVPQKAKDLASLIGEHQGVVLLSPEYNACLSPLLKNTIDWLSRDVGVKVYKDRVFALAACSPGGLGGIRVLSHMRDIMTSVVADTISPQLALGQANSAFTQEGDLANERAQGILQTLCETLIEKANHLK